MFCGGHCSVQFEINNVVVDCTSLAKINEETRNKLKTSKELVLVDSYSFLKPLPAKKNNKRVQNMDQILLEE